MTENAAMRHRWLYGPVPDLLFGCGLLYAIASLLFATLGGAVFQAIPLAVPVVLIALISAPHYGATLLRVYDRRSDRRAYFLFSVVATALIIAIFGISLVDRWIGSIFATVYLSWAGWHYTGQNYGISMMFLRRRGIDPTTLIRRTLYASFLLSYLLVFLVMHGQQAPVADPTLEIRLIPLAIPERFNAIAVPIVGIAYGAATLVSFGLLIRRAGQLGDLLPSILIAGIQALWWSIPYAARHFDLFRSVVPLSADLRGAFFTWVALAHAGQYLWITSYYARAAPGFDGQGRYYGRVLLAGSAVWTLPALAFAPGSSEIDWNFALLLAAAVNVHHFVLDGAIWKLRHTKIARVLIADEAEVVTGEREGGLLRIAVWTVAALSLALTVGSLADRFYVFPAAMKNGRLAAAAVSLDRQGWLGVTHSVSRFRLGRRFEAVGDLAEASAQYELSARIEPRVEPFRRLIMLYDRTGNGAGFVRACDGLFELDYVSRPLPTPAAETGPVPRAFREACIRVARDARTPLGPPAGAVEDARQDAAPRAPLTRYGRG